MTTFNNNLTFLTSKMINEIKSVKITGKGQISIPKEIRKKKGFKEGDKVILTVYEDKIELRPLSYIEEKFGAAIASEKSLSKEWDGEDEEWKDL